MTEGAVLVACCKGNRTGRRSTCVEGSARCVVNWGAFNVCGRKCTLCCELGGAQRVWKEVHVVLWAGRRSTCVEGSARCVVGWAALNVCGRKCTLCCELGGAQRVWKEVHVVLWTGRRSTCVERSARCVVNWAALNVCGRKCTLCCELGGAQRVWKEVHVVLWTGHKDREWATRGPGGWSTLSHRWHSVSTLHLCIFVVVRVIAGQVFVRMHRFSPSVTSPYPITVTLSFIHAFFRGSTVPVGLGPVSIRFPDHNRPTTLGRTPLDEWSARRRDLSIWQHTTLTRDRYACLR